MTVKDRGGQHPVPLLLEELVRSRARGDRAENHALNALIAIGGSRVAEGFVKHLDHPDVKVRADAAHALGELNAREAAGILRAKLSEYGIRAHVIEALGKLGDAESTGQIAKHLLSPRSDVRMASIHALGRLSGKEQVKDLIGFLEEGSAWVQEAVIQALVDLDAKEFYPEIARAIERRLGEQDQERLVQALARARWEQAASLFTDLLSKPDVSRVAAIGLGRLA